MVDETQPTQGTQKRKLFIEDDSETEPEPDSDNDDVQDEDADVEGEDNEEGKAGDEDDWLNIPSARSATLATQESAGERESDEWQEVKMGEDEEAMHYDRELIFKHL